MRCTSAYIAEDDDHIECSEDLEIAFAGQTRLFVANGYFLVFDHILFCFKANTESLLEILDLFLGIRLF